MLLITRVNQAFFLFLEFSLDLLKNYLNGTALKNAIDMGRTNGGTGCELTYRDCEWSNMQNKAWEVTKMFLIGYLGRQLL